ncbi:MAG: hypothetical protein ACR2RL_07625 [Gammaproteobacteria bacterium]
MKWPERYLRLGPAEVRKKARACEAAYAGACAEMQIDEDLGPYLKALYIPLAAWLVHERARADRALVIGITGGQGSGKSTVSALLSVVLREAFGSQAVALSIDDIYETRAARERLAVEVHPLFVTRGVPGTHDAALGIATIRSLIEGAGATCLPSFDKATDDRRPRSGWRSVQGPIDFVLFEGWCVGARAQSAGALAEPINTLEREEDPGAVWRTAVNVQLETIYRELFALIDVQIMLNVGSMARVYEWRRLQERKLRASVRDRRESNGQVVRVMTDAEVERFVMHYERLTRHLLREMPERADVVLWLDETHNAARVQINRSG